MNSWHRQIDPRAEELLADQAITGLDEQQAQELVNLLATDNAEVQDEFMRTAALVQLGIMSQKQSAAVADARASAQAHTGGRSRPASESHRAMQRSLTSAPLSMPRKRLHYGNNLWLAGQ